MVMGKDHELLEAARIGNIAVVGKILEQISKRSSGPFASFRRSPCINSQDVNGYTPLHHACLNGHGNIVRLLLAHNAAPDMPDIRGSTPLYLAAWAGHDEIVKQLLLHTPKAANTNAQTIDNETPLHCAAQHGHNTVLAILLAYGADPTVRNNSFQTALDLAAQFGRLQAVQTLIRTHPELLAPYRTPGSNNSTTSSTTGDSAPYTISPATHIFTHTCLHLASRNGHKKVVEALLAAGVDVNVMTNSGTALHEAALCGKKAVVNVLLQAGINPNATDGSGRTALDLLKDYPPHVTYEIACAIKDFYKDASNGTHFKPINEHSDDADDVERSETSVSPVPNFVENDAAKKVSAIAHKEFLMPKTVKPNGLSASMSSLEQSTKVPSNYLPMKPIFWQNSHTGLTHLEHCATKHATPTIFATAYKPCSLLGLYSDQKRTKAGGAEKINNALISPSQQAGSMCDLHKTTSVVARKRCVDEYVEMIPPKPVTSSSIGKVSSPNTLTICKNFTFKSTSTQHNCCVNIECDKMTDSNTVKCVTSSKNTLTVRKKPLPNPRSIRTAHDYANINHILTTSNTRNSINSTKSAEEFASSTSQMRWNQNPPSPFSTSTSPSKDANNNSRNKVKQTKHSPTPDFPPPSVTQAEHTILEYIRPKSDQSQRHSLNLKQQQQPHADLEAFIVDAINQFELPLLPDSPESSRASECVEEYVGDAPFAGLLKGSNLNLAMESRDENSAFNYIPSGLRSPSLVRSIKFVPPRRNISQQNKSIAASIDDFNASKVWAEIDTILQNIGHEVNEVDECNQQLQNSTVKCTDMLPTTTLTGTGESSLQMRRPADLCLGDNDKCSTTNWCHSPNTLIFGQIMYTVYYLGSTVIRELHGIASTRKSILKFKRNATPLPVVKERESNLLKDCNNLTKMLKESNQDTRLKVGLAVSCAGVKFCHAEDNSTICAHDIENINCVCQDSEDLRYFAYITKEDEMHYCHVFMVDNVELSQEIILTLAEAFEIAYQLVLNKDDEALKSKISKTMDYNDTGI